MRSGAVRRAASLSVAWSLATAGLALADTAPADADTLTAGIQGSRHLGEVVPGAVFTVDVGFTLRCANSAHAERGSTITVEIESQTTPLDGNAELITAGRIGPVPSDWPLDGELCPGGTGDPSLDASVPATIRLTAPTTVGTGYEYVFLFARTPDTGLTGLSAVTFILDVAEADDPDHPDGPGDPADPPALAAVWVGPLANASPLVANLARTVPVRVALFADGTAVTPADDAAPRLEVARLDACGGTAGTTVATLDLRWDDGHWGAQLATRGLGAGCWRLTAIDESGAYGSTDLLVVDGGPGQAKAAPARGAR